MNAPDELEARIGDKITIINSEGTMKNIINKNLYDLLKAAATVVSLSGEPVPPAPRAAVEYLARIARMNPLVDDAELSFMVEALYDEGEEDEEAES